MDTRKFFLLGACALAEVGMTNGSATAQEPKPSPPEVTIEATGKTVPQPNVKVLPPGFFLISRFNELLELGASFAFAKPEPAPR
jgi:hypothetical protein